MSNFETIDPAFLVTATGGQQQGQRTWGQVGRDYAAACVQGAGRSLADAGPPRDLRDAATNAAVGCAMGIGNRAVADLTNVIGGDAR